MKNVLLAVQNGDILAAITALNVWGDKTGFEITAVASDIQTLGKVVGREQYDLLIIETFIARKDDFHLLRKIARDDSCKHIVFCSKDGDFETARQGILLGIDEYFVLPFEEELFLRVFDKIKLGDETSQADIGRYVKELVVYFDKQTMAIHDYVKNLRKNPNFSQILERTVNVFFEQNDWIDLYYDVESCYLVNASGIKEQEAAFMQLFEAVCKLYPPHNESLQNVILHILYNPESDLRQKNLSEQLRLNKSYLSTVFTAQTGLRFVDYITNVKMMRAAWLLQNTDMKISEIADRMDYKDIAYFSKLFKKHFHITPSEYRIPDNYHFAI